MPNCSINQYTVAVITLPTVDVLVTVEDFNSLPDIVYRWESGTSLGLEDFYFGLKCLLDSRPTVDVGRSLSKMSF